MVNIHGGDVTCGAGPNRLAAVIVHRVREGQGGRENLRALGNCAILMILERHCA